MDIDYVRGLLLRISMTEPAVVRNGAEIGLPGLRLSVSQGASLGWMVYGWSSSV